MDQSIKIVSRCKFKCDSKQIMNGGDARTVNYSFTPVTSDSPENKSFWKWTPTGKLEISCANPNVDFEPGKEYYLDITEVK